MKGMMIVVFLLVSLSGWVYGGWHATYAHQIVFDTGERPYVYRVLVPGLTRLLWLAGVPVERALQIVIACSVLGLFYALYYLFTAFQRKQL